MTARNSLNQADEEVRYATPLRPVIGLGALLFGFSLGVAVVVGQGASDPPASAARHALTATVTPDVFCSFLPPQPGGNIGDTESNAVVFCNKPSPDAPDANIFPSGFIETAHFAKGPGFVQVTGRIDRSAYGLSSSDGGGQFGSNDAPPGARVFGAKKFVNLVEPDVQHFCIRACTDPSKCNTGESAKGCDAVIPGDYQ